jgi:membrane protein
VRWPAAIVGGVVAGTFWHFLKDAFTWYVTNVASYENVYGTVAILPVILVWIYLTMLLLLVGGALAFVVQNYRTLIAERRSMASQGPQRAWHAIAVLSALERAFVNEEQPISAIELGKRLGVAQFVIAESVRPLVRAGVVLQIPCRGEQRYALGIPAQHLTLARVVALTTGEDLSIPDDAHEPLRSRIASIFERAKKAEGNALETVTIADLSA